MAFIERKVIEIDWSSENKGTEIMGRLKGIETISYKDGPGLVYIVDSERYKSKRYKIISNGENSFPNDMEDVPYKTPLSTWLR